jgi:hypothetical protein
MGGAAVQGETPWSAVLAWSERRGLGPDDADFLVEMVRVLDAEHAQIERNRQR